METMVLNERDFSSDSIAKFSSNPMLNVGNVSCTLRRERNIVSPLSYVRVLFYVLSNDEKCCILSMQMW